VGWQGNRLEAFYVPLGETFGFFTDQPNPLKTRHELVRLTDAGGDGQQTGQLDLNRVKVERFDAGALAAGTLVAQGDELYYVGYTPADVEKEDAEEEVQGEEETGESSYPAYGWRWDGDAFVSIPTEEARKIWKDYGDEAERRERRMETAARTRSNERNQAWKLCPISAFVGGSNNCAVKLSGQQWRFQLRETSALLNFEDMYKAEIPFTLRARSSDGNVTTPLINDSGKWEEVSAAGYAAQQDARLSEFAGKRYGNRLFTPANGLRILLPLLIFLGVYYGLIRKALNGSISPSRYYPEARPADFPILDQERLAQYTADLEARGFMRLRDFTVVSPEGATPQPPTFVRLFAHPQLHCYAEVGQVFTDKPAYDSVIRMNVTLESHFAEPGWTLATTDRPAASASYVFRKPCALWQCRPGLSLDQLIAAHTDVYRQMTITLALHHTPDYAAETYFKLTEAAITETRELAKRRARFVLPLMFEMARRKSEQHYEWLGDYGLYASPSGWTPPSPQRAQQPEHAAFYQTDDEPYRQPAWKRLATVGGWQQLVLNWSELIGVFATVCLGTTLYFWLVLPAPGHPGTRLFRLGVTLVGLFAQFIVWLAKRSRSTYQ
jgi:hypothetical protein